jgi:putative nucleotidyltransferase with HDIG domain
MKKVVKVNELSIGMFVVRVTKSNGSAVMKSQGSLRTQESIERLKKLKVQEVEIDTSKSITPEAEESLITPLHESNDLDSTAKLTTPLTQEIKRAQEIYKQAREVQHHAFQRVQSEGEIDLSGYEDIASELFDSIYRNQDALLCMTKLQDKDSYLLEHSINVAILLAIFAKHLGLNKDISLKLTLAGLLHDIGKVKVPDEILFKQGKLTKDEFEEIKKHPSYGADILTVAGLDGLTIQIALQHHERLSGIGYPSGLIEHQLNQYVRMACIVDVFDAITAERVYKRAMTPSQAFKIIKESGSEFDDRLLNQFIRSVGLFSVGSVVLMKSQKLAIVTQTNYKEPLQPTLTAFYHTKFKRHISATTIDLSSRSRTDSIQKVVNAADYDIDINMLIERFIIDI